MRIKGILKHIDESPEKAISMYEAIGKQLPYIDTKSFQAVIEKCIEIQKFESATKICNYALGTEIINTDVILSYFKKIKNKEAMDKNKLLIHLLSIINKVIRTKERKIL